MAKQQEAPENQPVEDSEIATHLTRLARRVRGLTVAVFFMALALLFTVSAVLGNLIEYHAGESILIAGTCAGGAAMGFAFGLLAGRKL
jgi:hypothetical protein